MKLSKVLLGSAVAVALVVGFTGCPQQLGTVDIKYSEAFDEKTKANATGSVDFDNTEGTSDARGMRLLRTAHKGMFAKISLNELTENSTNPGVMGFVFGLEEKKDEDENTLYDFYLVGIRNDNGKLRTYLSKFTDISEEQFDDENLGAKVNAESGASEIEIKKISTYTDYKRNATNNNMEVAIKIVANEDGSYAITWYNAEGKDCADLVAKDAELTEIGPKTVNISTEITGAESDKNLDKKIGFYANVYKGQMMKGNWYLADLEGNPIPAEFDDTIASPLFN